VRDLQRPPPLSQRSKSAANFKGKKKMTKIYCPICQRFISPDNQHEVETGEHEGFIYVHDDIAHGDEDIEALENGVQ
jgi:hypothetical protein